jgi:hypothetical protein
MEESEYDETPIDTLFQELKITAKGLVEQYNICAEGARKIIKKVEYAESQAEEILLVPKAATRRWLEKTGISEKEVFTVDEFLKTFFSNAAKSGRLEYATLMLTLTPEEMCLFGFKQSDVSYFQFMSHLPLVFA